MPLTVSVGENTLTDDQIDHIHQWLCKDVLPAFGVSEEAAKADAELWEIINAEMNAAAQIGT